MKFYDIQASSNVKKHLALSETFRTNSIEQIKGGKQGDHHTERGEHLCFSDSETTVVRVKRLFIAKWHI